ncbi:hypothetical protein MC885_009890 [Smutsia gigantea]|nr:hypothetical protein MC885_009890 [Smutsia gigantea]
MGDGFTGGEGLGNEASYPWVPNRWEILSWWGWEGTSTWSHWLAGRAHLGPRNCLCLLQGPTTPWTSRGSSVGHAKGSKDSQQGGVDSEMGYWRWVYTPPLLPQQPRRWDHRRCPFLLPAKNTSPHSKGVWTLPS